MNTIETIRVFLGWCSVINIGLLSISSIILVTLRSPVARIHAKLFDVAEMDLARIYLQFIGNYKMLIIVFNIVPYFALRIMS